MGLWAKPIRLGYDFDPHVYQAWRLLGEKPRSCIAGRHAASRAERLRSPVHTRLGAPTLVINVETLANVPPIVSNGAYWFSGLGTEHSKGTKIFSPCGDVLLPGVIEVPFGITVREVLFDIAGGSRSGADIKAVMIGGPSGVMIGPESFDRTFASKTSLPCGRFI